MHRPPFQRAINNENRPGVIPSCKFTGSESSKCPVPADSGAPEAFASCGKCRPKARHEVHKASSRPWRTGAMQLLVGFPAGDFATSPPHSPDFPTSSQGQHCTFSSALSVHDASRLAHHTPHSILLQRLSSQSGTEFAVSTRMGSSATLQTRAAFQSVFF